MASRRVAYVRAIDLALWSLVRVDATVSERAVAVMDSPHTTRLAVARVLACTSAARALGVRAGQSGHQARAVAPEVVLRSTSPEALRSARSALMDAAATVSPRLEPDHEGVWAEVGDLTRLYPDEVSLATALGQAGRRVGLRVSVAIAGGRNTARIAARRRTGATVVPDGEAREFLAGLPIEAMGLSEELYADLVRFGVTRVSELARLPAEGVGVRLGEEAARAVQLACGIDDDPIVPRPLPMRFEEAMEFDWELSEVEPLMFAMRRLYEALVARLACRSLAVGALSLSLTLSTRVLDERMVSVASPTRDVPSLLKLTRASLDANPPIDAVVGARVVAVPAALKPLQLGLFDPPGPAPDKLALTLTKLVALVGDDRVGAPAVPDTWRPYAVAVATFNPPRGRLDARSQGVSTMALHIFRPPRPADVVLSEGRIARVLAREIQGRVLACGGPWRSSGQWWSEGFDHEVYDVELDDGGIYLVGFDRARGVWQLDGVYE